MVDHVKSVKKKKKLKRSQIESRTPIAKEAIIEALDKTAQRLGRKVMPLDIAEHVDISVTSLWFGINSDRSWPADRWLHTMNLLGCISFQGDHIIISSKTFAKYAKQFNDSVKL